MYNIVANQALATPVTSFNKGRALAYAEREAGQDYALGEQKRRMNALALEQASKPDPAEQRAEDAARRQRGIEMLSFRKNWGARTFSIYQQALKSGASEADARAAAQQASNDDLKFAAATWGELANRIDPDHTWTPEEAFGAFVQPDALQKAGISHLTTFRDANGRVVGFAAEGTPEYDRFLANGAGPGMELGRPKDEAQPEQAGTTRDAKISSLEEMGLPHGMAVKITDGIVKMEVVPQTGAVRLLDLSTQRASEVPLGATATLDEIPAPPPGQSLWDLAHLGTGPVSAGLAGGSVVTGLVGGPVAEETVRARQTLASAPQALIRALAINPRFPVAEMERLRDEVSIEPSIFDNEQLMRARMQAIDAVLRTRLAQAERDAKDTSLPRDTREAEAQNASAIRNFLMQLGVPQAPSKAELELDSETKALVDKYAPAQQ